MPNPAPGPTLSHPPHLIKTRFVQASAPPLAAIPEPKLRPPPPLSHIPPGNSVEAAIRPQASPRQTPPNPAFRPTVTQGSVHPQAPDSDCERGADVPFRRSRHRAHLAGSTVRVLAHRRQPRHADQGESCSATQRVLCRPHQGSPKRKPLHQRSGPQPSHMPETLPAPPSSSAHDLFFLSPVPRWHLLQEAFHQSLGSPVTQPTGSGKVLVEVNPMLS